MENILSELQENVEFLEKQTVSEWLSLLKARNFWTETELQQQLNVSSSDFDAMKISQNLPSTSERSHFKNLLNQ